MGRVTAATTTAATQSPSQITHFSHPHPLFQIPPNQTYPPRLCSGCNLQTSGKITYFCQPCNFILHQSCASLPKHITHPCHPSCTLTLLTHPTYPEGVFSCDACNRQGKSWSYHCSRGCDVDLHVTCASKPLKIKHHAHACHLELTFKSPYPGTNGFSCDICRVIGEKQWLYRCHRCGFDVHLDCTKAAPVLQHQHSMPATISNNIHQNTVLHHHHSMPVQGQPIGYAQPGNQNIRPVQNVNNPNGFETNLLQTAMTGFVDGVFQATGQAVMQEVISAADYTASTGVDYIGGGGGGGVDYTGGGGVDYTGGVEYSGSTVGGGGEVDLYAVGDCESTQ